MSTDEKIDDSVPTEEELAQYRENMAKHKAAVEEMRGHRVDTARMLKNRALMMSSMGISAGDRMNTTNWDVMPDDPAYAETCRLFGLNQPGDSNSRGYRWIYGEWVDESQLPPES
ncbi:MAG TPA: hypothetical protein V6C69_07935 [Trichormus sp.]|jgi:hypothetical protein